MTATPRDAARFVKDRLWTFMSCSDDLCYLNVGRGSRVASGVDHVDHLEGIVRFMQECMTTTPCLYTSQTQRALDLAPSLGSYIRALLPDDYPIADVHIIYPGNVNRVRRLNEHIIIEDLSTTTLQRLRAIYPTAKVAIVGRVDT